MSEKRGYPNPNYTEEDILSEEEAELLEEIGMVTVDVDRYEKLVAKAAALDILTASIQRKGDIDDDVVLAVTGAIPSKEIEELKRDKDNYMTKYWQERDKNEKLQRKLAEAECSLNELHRDDPDWPPKDEEVSENE